MSSIFISHNFRDKPFARRLANDLQRAKIRVWLDEAEIKLGDSLLEKVSIAIKQMDYLGVILSKNSVASEWVKREVNIALTQEISGRKVKVLPILVEPCSIPAFLQDKFYADFSSSKKYISGLQLILDRLCPKSPLSAQSIVENSDEWNEAHEHVRTIKVIFNDEYLLRNSDALTEVVIPRLGRISEICKELSECPADEEIRNFLLTESQNKIDANRRLDAFMMLWFIRNSDVDKYIIKSFWKLDEEMQFYLIKQLSDDPDPKYLPLIKRLLRSGFHIGDLKPDTTTWLQAIIEKMQKEI